MKNKIINNLINYFFILLIIISLFFIIKPFKPKLEISEKPTITIDTSKIERASTGDEYRRSDLIGEVETERIPNDQLVKIETSSLQILKSGDLINNTIRKYRRKLILNTQFNNKDIYNYIISISMDSLDKIRDSKLSPLCDQIYFTEEDGHTIINHWLEHGCGSDVTKFWLRIPFLKTHTKKTIYMYYGNERIQPLSDFKKVFQRDPYLVGWYYFDDNMTKKVIDFSGYGNDGNLSRIETGSEWGAGHYFGNSRPYIFFNDYQKWYDSREESVYFTIPTKNMQFLTNTYSIETRIKFYNLSEFITQRIFTDDKNQFEFGKLSNGNLYFRLDDNYNRLVWNTRLNNWQWYHLVLSWDFPKKEIKLYVDGNEIEPITSNNKFIINQISKIENLEFGGYYTGTNYGLCGILDCLKIYNNVKTASEANLFMNINQRSLRFMTYAEGNEEIVQSNPENYQKIDFNLVSKYPISNQLVLNLIYASPLNEKWGYSKGIDKTLKDPPMIIDRMNNDDNPVFGFSGHFCSYTGTDIIVKNIYFAEYVGLKINDISLIKDLKIDFTWLEDYSQNEYFWRSMGILEYLIPSAKACGSLYSYRLIGDSKLELVSTAKGIYWFKVIKPIYIDPTVCVMQIYYKSNSKQGNITIELSDMIFKDSNNNIFRPTLMKKIPVELSDNTGAKKDLVLPARYKATFPSVESGAVDFMQNKNNGLDIVFKNTGYDTIILNKKMFDYIYNNLFTNIRIFELKDLKIMDLTLKEIQDKLLNKTIDRGYYLHFQILPSSMFDKNKYYHITFKELDSNNYIEQPSEDYIHLISWMFGKDEYRYRYNYFSGSSRLIYKFIISEKGIYQFSIPED